MPEEQVFISYSHKDKKWRDDLDKHLKPYLRDGSIVSWSDQQIAPGSEWFREIQSALSNSKVAVLLVSADFLASDFIHEHELGPLLKEPQQGEVKIRLRKLLPMSLNVLLSHNSIINLLLRS